MLSLLFRRFCSTIAFIICGAQLFKEFRMAADFICAWAVSIWCPFFSVSCRKKKRIIFSYLQSTPNRCALWMLQEVFFKGVSLDRIFKHYSDVERADLSIIINKVGDCAHRSSTWPTVCYDAKNVVVFRFEW